MVSAFFKINGSNGPVNVGGSTSVTLALASTAGVKSVDWEIYGTSNMYVAAPVITKLGSPYGSTASFITRANPCGYGIRCIVNGGKDDYGRPDKSLFYQTAVYVLDGNGLQPPFVNEQYERGQNGWLDYILGIGAATGGSPVYKSLTEVLAIGNQTLGKNIVLTEGDSLVGSAGNLKLDGYINVNNHKITNVSAPTNPLDVVNKAYADSLSGGITTVVDNAARDAIPSSKRKEGMLVYSQKTKSYYSLAVDLTTWNFYNSSPELVSQAAWYVDGATGNDNNDGATSGTALATSEELSRRLSPNNRRFVPLQNVAIHFAAGNYGELKINAAFLATTGLGAESIQVICAISSSASITLSAVTNTVAGTTRGQVTTTGSTAFTANARITSTSGAAVGAVTYSTGQNANTKNHFVKEWFNYNTGAVATVASGTTCKVETLLVSFKRIDLDIEGPGYFEIDDAKLNGEIKGETNSAGGTIDFVGCEYTGNTFAASGDIYGSINWWNCNFIDKRADFSEQFPGLYGCVVQSTAEIRSYPSASLGIFAGNCINGGKVSSVEPGGNVIVLANCEFCNGNASGAAIELATGATLVVTAGLLWGASSVYGFGVLMGSLCKVSTPNNTTITIPATVQLNMTGHNLTYADVPRAYDRADCVWAISPDPLASDNSTFDPSIVANWYVNVSAGSDSNDGQSAGTAFATLKKLSAVLCPGGATLNIKQDTTVSIAGGTYPDGIQLRIFGPFIFSINGTKTSSSNITLSSVVNTAPGSVTMGSGTRGQIATSFGTFAVGQMLRCVSGSHVGAVAFVQELNGDAQHAYVTHWHTEGTNRAAQVDLTAGDVVVIDTNTTLISYTQIYQGGASVIRIRNVNGNTGYIPYACRTESPYGVIFDCCSTAFVNNLSNGEGGFKRCQGGWFGVGGYIQYFGGNHFTGNYLYSHTKIDFSGGDVVTGSGFQFYDCEVQLGLDWSGQGSTYGIQFENNGNTSCIVVGGGATFLQGFGLPLWGLTGTTGVGIQVDPGGSFQSSALPTINATTPMKTGALTFSSYQAYVLPGYNAYSFNSTGPIDILSDGSLKYLSTVANPQLFQVSASTVGATGKTFNISSQTMTGTNSRGGNLALASGTGIANDVNVNASDGYVTISRGANIVASWTDGNSDYITLGGRFNPASGTGAIRLPKNGTVSFRNSGNTGDLAGLFTTGATTVINGETLVGGVQLAGAGTPLWNVSSTGTQAIMTLSDATASIMQFNGGAGLGAATLQIKATTGSTGANLVINSQAANVTGGNLILSAGNGGTSGAQGRVKLTMGGYLSGSASGIGLQMLELANLGTVAVPASVLSLCSTTSMSTSLLTGSFGDGVVYLGRALTQPLAGATPVNGTLIYSGVSGEFCTRDGYGIMNLGDAQSSMVLNYASLGSGSLKIVADGRLQLKLFGTAGMTLYDSNFSMEYGGAASISRGNGNVAGDPGGFSIAGRNNTNSAGIGGGLSLRAGSATSGTGVGGTLTLEPGIGFDGTTANGNIGIGLRSSSYNFQSMANGVMINTAYAAPTGNPTGGFFLWVDPSDGKLKARGPSGTVTDVALP